MSFRFLTSILFQTYFIGNAKKKENVIFKEWGYNLGNEEYFKTVNIGRTQMLGIFSVSSPEDKNNSTLMPFGNWLDNTHEVFRGLIDALRIT